MALAMSLHFFGYEFARGSNMALFTSNALGFGTDSASYYTLAMTCVSPMSMVLLLGYGRLLDSKGPKRALVTSTGFCMGVLALFGVAISTLGRYNVSLGNTNWTISQVVVWASFVFQNSYAHLLYAQMWSFLGSIFTPSQAGTYYSYVAGLSSIASMIAGASVSRIVTWSGVPGLLGVASLSLFGSLLLAARAYSLAEKNGFDPSMEMQRKSKKKMSVQSNDDDKESKPKRHILQQIKEGVLLFQRVPVLAALFCETITFQSLCTVLNTSLVIQLKDAVPDDQSRAAWTGRFYGATNGLSTLFQFLIMPALSQRVDPKSLWIWMPIIPAMCAIFQVLSKSMVFDAFSAPVLPLYLVAFSFFTAKSKFRDTSQLISGLDLHVLNSILYSKLINSISNGLLTTQCFGRTSLRPIRL
jgi:MFS family permease